MAAEDWIDWMDYIDVDYDVQYRDIIGPPRPYTDKFIFNGRRLRTRRQEEILAERSLTRTEFNKFLQKYPNSKLSYDLETLIGQEVVIDATVIKRGKLVLTKEMLAENKFYIGSKSIFNRPGKWGHPTLDEAVQHAQTLLAENENEQEVFIVEIVRVVKRKPIEVIIDTV